MKFYTDAELCERWRTNPMGLWRWRKRGSLGKPINPGGHKNLTSEDQVKALEAGKRVEGDNDSPA
jgi:predicted site-specific integrase-resolvase